MPILGGMQVEPRVGDECSAVYCSSKTRPTTGLSRRLLHCKAVGGFAVYLTLCTECYNYIQDNLEAIVLLLHVDTEEAIVGQVMQE